MKNFLLTVTVCFLFLSMSGCGTDAVEEMEPETIPPTLAEPTSEQTSLPAESSETAGEEDSSAPADQGEVMESKLTIISPVFENGDPIPVEYSCDGEDISPELIFSGIPDGTRSLALIVDDPDAPIGTWVHWVLFNLPPDTDGLPRGASGIGTDGQNSWKRAGYGGPCPPGGTHRYFFKLYAVDQILDLQTDTNKKQLEAALEGHILEQAELMGTFSR